MSLTESRQPRSPFASPAAPPPSSEDSAVQQLIGTQKDWCGSKGSEWVPEGALGVDWSGACRAHDECYGAPGANKLLCDYALQEDMSVLCAEQGGGIACHVIAGIYFTAVHYRGQEAFDNAQNGTK